MVLAICATTSCTATPTPTQVGDAGEEPALIRYSTSTLTPTVTPTLMNAPTATLAPTQTATPRLYSVKANDTLIGIAFRNGLTLDEIKAANPDADPYMLPLGSTLYIPAPSGVSATAQAPTPVPESMEVGSVTCHPTASGGRYCFAWLKNVQAYDLERISAEFRLTDPAGAEVRTRPATIPVSRIASGSAVPVFAYFAPPLVVNPLVEMQLLTSLQASEGSTLPVVEIGSSTIEIAEDGLSASVTGQVQLAAESADAQTLWITAIALDAGGTPVGIRRLELADGIKAGETKPFTLSLYALSGRIDKIDLYLDALP